MCIYIYIYVYIYIYTYIHTYIHSSSDARDSLSDALSEPFQTGVLLLGRPILYTTTTTQRGWFIEAFVSILVQSQSQKSLPGAGGV